MWYRLRKTIYLNTSFRYYYIVQLDNAIQIFFVGRAV